MTNMLPRICKGGTPDVGTRTELYNICNGSKEVLLYTAVCEGQNAEDPRRQRRQQEYERKRRYKKKVSLSLDNIPGGSCIKGGYADTTTTKGRLPSNVLASDWESPALLFGRGACVHRGVLETRCATLEIGSNVFRKVEEELPQASITPIVCKSRSNYVKSSPYPSAPPRQATVPPVLAYISCRCRLRPEQVLAALPWEPTVVLKYAAQGGVAVLLSPVADRLVVAPAMHLWAQAKLRSLSS